MDKYREVTNLIDLITNRIGVCNTLLGCRYAHANGNPVGIHYRNGVYRFSVCGEEIMSVRACDVDGLQRLFEIVDKYVDCIWYLGRGNVDIRVRQ